MLISGCCRIGGHQLIQNLLVYVNMLMLLIVLVDRKEEAMTIG